LTSSLEEEVEMDSLSQPEGGFWLGEKSENQTVLFLRLKKKYEDSVKEM
jgi:hypothetical protein